MCKVYALLNRSLFESKSNPIIRTTNPTIVKNLKDSFNKNIPSNEAVRGSAKAKVTAVEASTLFSPRANKIYANAVAINPRCKIDKAPDHSKTQLNSA